MYKRNPKNNLNRLIKVLKRSPHYLSIGLIVSLLVVAAVVSVVTQNGRATNNFELVRSFPVAPFETATFNEPKGMARDSSNNLYVVDSGNARIQKFDSSGNYISQFGARGSANGSLDRPLDVAVSGDGTIYVTNAYGSNDTSWETIKYDSNGSWLATWPGRTEVNPASAMIAVDSNSNIYIFDGTQYSVTKYNSDGVEQLEWPLEKPVGWGCAGCPGGIAVDSNGVIYVGNYVASQKRVDRFDSSGNFLGSWSIDLSPTDLVIDQNDELLVAGSGINYVYRYGVDGSLLGQWGNYDGTPPTADGAFSGSGGIEVINGKVWAVDPGLGNRVQKFDLTGNYEAKIGGLGDGQLKYPAAAAIDSTGSLNVLDVNGRVQIFNSITGAYQAQFGSFGYSGGQISDPRGVAVDAAGNRYVVASSSRIEKFDSTGTHVDSWGGSGSGDGQLSNAQDIIADTAGNTYVVDAGNNRIQKFDSNGGFITKWTTNSTPTDIDFDSAGNVWVSSRYSASLQKFTSSGGSLTGLVTELSPNMFISSFSVDADDNVYTIEVNSSGTIGYVAMYSQSGDKWGQWGAVGSGDLEFRFTNSLVGADSDIVIDSNNHIFVVDTNNNRVQEFTHQYQLTIDSTTLENGVVGSAYNDSVEYSGARDNLAFSVLSGSLPSGLILNGATGEISGTPTQAGNFTFEIQAQDSQYTDVQQYSLRINAAPTVPDVVTLPAENIGVGSVDLKGATSPKGVTERGFEYGVSTGYGSQSIDASAGDLRALPGDWGSYGTGEGQISNTLGMDIDVDGNVYVADSANNRISKYDPAGNHLLSWGSTGTGNGQFNQPQGVLVGNDGYIYTSEITNNRIQKFDINGNYVSQWPIAVISPAYATQTWGIAMDSQQNIYVATNIKDGPGLYVDENSVIQKYDTSGNLLLQWGSEGNGNGQFAFASSYPKIAIDSNDGVYVSDVGNNRIQKFDTNGTFTFKIGGDGIEYMGRGSEPGQFSNQYDIAVDSLDNLYVTDPSNDRVQKFDSNGTFLQLWPSTELLSGLTSGYEPLLIGVDPKDNIIIEIPNLSGSGGLVFREYAMSVDSPLSNLSCGTIYHYRAFATNEVGTAYGEDQTFTTDACPQVNITNTTLSSGGVAQIYSDSVVTEGGAGTQSFVLSAGSLPGGLSLNSANGQITGTPTQAGSFLFSVTVTDDYGSDTQEYELVIDTLESPLAITTLSLADGTVGVSYSAAINTQYELGSKLYILSSGSLPTGLIHDSQTGTISGTPTEEGVFTFTMSVYDDYSLDQRQYTVTISAAPDEPAPDPLTISTTTLNDGRVGDSYTGFIEAANSVGAVEYTVSEGLLPDGLSMNSLGVISGIPTNPGLYEFTVQAADDNMTDIQILQLEVLPEDEEPITPQIYIETQVLSDGVMGETYSKTIVVNDSEGAVTFEILSGSLPDGLQLTSAGAIVGVPSRLQTSVFTVKASDDNGSDQEEYSLRIIQKPGDVVINPDGTVNIERSEDKTLAKEAVVAQELEEISGYNETLAKPIGVLAEQFNITPRQVISGLPWLVMSLFGLFTALMASRSYMQINTYKSAKRRQEFNKQLIEEKSTFVALASHYLRTPITVIKGGIELMGNNVSGAVSGLQAAGSRLTKAVNDVIEKIEKGGKGE